MRTLVIQSHNLDARVTWLRMCLASVEGWAARCGFHYRFHGDEALQLTPDWYRAKLGNRKAIVADLARLVLIRDALESGYEQACWLDADVLLFAPGNLVLNYPQSCAFGREYWVTADGRNRLRARPNVHNAICVFRAGCPVLPFLIHATEQIIRRVDPEHIAPQIVGPKLLGAMHNIVGFDLIDSVGAFSPAVIDALQDERDGESRHGTGPASGSAVEVLRAKTPVGLAGANLCTSLLGDRDLTDLCAGLLDAGCLPGQPGPG